MRTRTKKRICIALGLLAFVLVLGFVGAAELGTMNLGKAAAWAFSCEALGTLCLYKSGVLGK